MNSNFLCKVYGVRGYRVTGQCHKDNKTILKIERKHVKICCRHCGNIGISLDGSRIRDILGVPFGLRKTLLRVRIRRYRCPKCGHVCQESVPFVTGNRHYSHRFAQYAAVLLKTCTIKSVAMLLSVSWDTVKRIHKEYLRRRYTPVSLKGVRNIGIDEFSIRRGVEFRYPVNSGLAIDDVFVGFERNVFDGDMVVIDDACLVGNKFAVLVTNFGEFHLFYGEVLVGVIRPSVLPDIDVTNNFYAKETMCQHGHFRKKCIIVVMSCRLHVNALLVVQVQVGKLLTGFIKGHEVLNIIHDRDAWQ